MQIHSNMIKQDNIILKFNIKVTKEKLENQIIMVHKILKHQLKSIKMQITL